MVHIIEESCSIAESVDRGNPLPEAITDVLHPLLDKTNKSKKEEAEDESNQIVIVPYKGKRYRVDFTKEGEELQLLPRHLKKILALEDIQTTVDAQELQQIKDEEELKDLARRSSSTYNKLAQREKRASTIDRMREKLRLMNPLKYKDIHRDSM